MTFLIVAESYFGNTWKIAEVMAEELGVTLTTVANAPDVLPEDVKLVIAGAPTHNRGLPTPKTRDSAAKGGGDQNQANLAEWLKTVSTPDGVRFLTFDTVTSRGFFAGSAAKAAAAILGRRGIEARRGVSFLVGGNPPRLAIGEDRRARLWASDYLPYMFPL